MSSETPTRVLVLGAGRVSGPLYQEFALHSKVKVTAVSIFQSELDRVGELCPLATLELINISNDMKARDQLISDNDIIVGLVPYSMLYDVAVVCLRLKKHLVTASYIDAKMQSLHQQVADSDLTFLCESGLDPGIDHMLAMRSFDDIRDRGGKILSYELWCAGLPTPGAADNPLKYKFSWFPRGSLFACCRGGGYLKNGQVKEFPPGSAIMENATDQEFTNEFDLEGFPNVYKSTYLSLYGLDDVDTFIRGTLRYRGFSTCLLSVMKLGLLDVTAHPALTIGTTGVTWRKYLCSQLGLPEDVSISELKSKVMSVVAGQNQLDQIERLGLLTEDEIEAKGLPLDTFAAYLEKKPEFTFGPTEPDVVIMHINVVGKLPNGTIETRDVDMVVYGDVNGHTAMAKTVGRTLALATMLIVNGRVKQRGIVLPTSRDIYTPILLELNKKGVLIKEKTTYN